MRSDYSDIDPSWTSDKPFAFHAASGTAFVTVDGPLLFSMPAGMERYAPYVGAVHAGALVSTLRGLAARADVRHVALDVNSPGGHAYGVTDLADAFAALRASGKTTSAIAHDQATSQAMLIMALCDHAEATPTACLGSIGTTCLSPYVDDSDRWAREGLKAFYPHVGDHKLAGAPGAVLTDEMRAALQRFVEGISLPYHQAIATGRGLEVGAILALNGAVLGAPDALAAGLVDSVTTFAAWRSALLAAPAAPRTLPTPPGSSNRPRKESAMPAAPVATPAPTPDPGLVTSPEPAAAPPMSAPAVGPHAEVAATVAELSAAFGADPAFVLGQLKAGATLNAAYRARHDLLAARVAELSAARPISGSAGVAPAVPSSRPSDFAAAARAAWAESPGNVGRALLSAARSCPTLYAAWQKAGRPSIEFEAD